SAGIALMYVDEPPKAPLTFSRVEIKGSGSVTLGLGVKDPNAGRHSKDPYFNPNIGVKLGVNGSAGILIAKNSATGETSYSYDLSGTYEGSASWGIGADGSKKTYTGTVKLTYGK